MSEDSPLVRVELEFADGSIRRLVGPPADAWLEDLNNITAFHHIRTGCSAMRQDYQWDEISPKAARRQKDPFADYEGTD